MATPVVLVDAGGIAVTEAASGVPLTPVSDGGFPVTIVASGGLPVTLVNVDGSAYASTPTVPLIIIAGESNSAGIAPNSDATAGELSARSGVQMLNVLTNVFEPLHIGVNNNLDHAGATSATHGIELELANAVDAGRFTQSPLYVVQTGQGGSNIHDFDVGSATGFWTKFVNRVNTANSLLSAAGKVGVPVVFYTQGINDAFGNNLFGGGPPETTPAGWKTATIAHLAKIRALLGANTLIVLTKFSNYATYNAKIDEIIAADTNCRAIFTDNTGLELQSDGNHWTYRGYKITSQLFIDEWLAANGQASAPTFSPAPGKSASAQTITISGTGAIKYSTDKADVWGASDYSGGFSETPPTTVTARAIVAGKKSSAIVSAAYGPAGSALSTTDAGSVFDLFNGNLTARRKVGSSTYRTIRGDGANNAGKLYVEWKCAQSGGNGSNFYGFASSGFDVSSYLGTSAYSVAFANGAFYGNGFTSAATVGPNTNPTLNEVYMLAIDFTAGKIWFGKNNAWQASGDPAAGTNPCATFTPATVGALTPAMSLAGGDGMWTLQSQASLQSYAAPTGFTAWDSGVIVTTPGQVTGLTAGTLTATTAPLSWTAPSTGSAPTDYLVEYRLSPAGSWTTFSHSASSTASITVTGLTASTAYDFRVSGVNSAGTGTASSTITGTTATAPAASAWSTTDATAGGFTLTSSNQIAVKTGSGYKSLRGDTSRSSGLLYFELACTVSGGNAYEMLGLANAGFSAGNYLGTSASSIGMAANGTTYVTDFTNVSAALPTGNPTAGEVYMIAVNFTTGKLWLGKNGSWLASGDPAAGTGEKATFTPATVGALFPAYSAFDGSEGTWKLQTGSGNQTYAPPTGFTAWG